MILLAICVFALSMFVMWDGYRLNKLEKAVRAIMRADAMANGLPDPSGEFVLQVRQPDGSYKPVKGAKFSGGHPGPTQSGSDTPPTGGSGVKPRP